MCPASLSLSPSALKYINTCVPNFSLSLSLSLPLPLLLYTLLLFEQFALLLPLLTYCVSDLGLHLLFLLPLFYYNHSACLSNVFVCISMQSCHLNTSLFIVYLNHIFYHHHHFFPFSFFPLLSGFGSDFKITISLFFFFSFPPTSSPLTLSSFSSLLR